MAYIPTEWKCGDTITAEKLNNLEDGVQEALECCGGGAEPLIIRKDHVDGSATYYDKTWQEVHDAMGNGTPVAVLDDLNRAGVQGYKMEYFYQIYVDGTDYGAELVTGSTLYAASANGYLYKMQGNS